MIIECPACTSRYRIREDKLPENGGNIKCPSCAHVFFVPRGVAAPASSASAERLGSETPASTSQVPSLSPANVVVEPSSEPVSNPASGAATAKAGQRWKLKNQVGLVYDFPDSDQLRSWLGSRESFDGIQISSDAGQSWANVDDVPEFIGVRPSGRKSSIQPTNLTLGGASPDAHPPTPSGQYVSAADKMREEAEARLREARASRAEDSSGVSAVQSFRIIKPPANRQQEQTSKVLLMLAVLILPLIGAIGLHIVGVIDLADYGLLPPTQSPPTPPQVVRPAEQPAPEAEEEREPALTAEQVVAVLVEQAGAAKSRQEPAAAAEALEQAVEILPQDNELHCLLQPIYVELGRHADAERAMERCSGTAEGSAQQDPGAAAGP